MIYLKSSHLKDYNQLHELYQQIALQSKKCYIVTYALGTDHPVTHHYRDLKDWLLQYSWGQQLVRIYYTHSSVLVERWSENSSMHLVGKYLLAPLLTLFSKTILRRIIK